MPKRLSVILVAVLLILGVLLVFKVTSERTQKVGKTQNRSDLDFLQWAIRTTDSFMQRNPDFRITYEKDRNRHKWHYEQGLMLNALYQLWQYTGDQKYYTFIVNNIDLYLDDEGNIATYKQRDYKLDDIGPGRTLLRLYEKTGQPKYKKAADRLRRQLANQPRTKEGGFWHKKIYPYQLWLDGLYMAAPFYAHYAQLFDRPADFDDIVNQFKYIARHTYDSETGLYYHGWDEKRVQLWADPESGCSANFWGRGTGWYLMALVDVLDILPAEHSGRAVLLEQLQELSKALLKYRDPQSRVWYQVIDQGDREGNYPESSATAMFIYSFAKGANLGYLSAKYWKIAYESFRGFLDEFVHVSDDGLVNVLHACSGAGLGGKQQRDGSFEYYISEPQRTNDCKAVGTFIMAALELEKGLKK